MYFQVGDSVCVTCCDDVQFVGEITHIVIHKSEGEMEPLLFLQELPSQRETYGNACIEVNYIKDVVQYSPKE